MTDIYVLKVGGRDYKNSSSFPTYVKYNYFDELTEPLTFKPDMVFICKEIARKEIEILSVTKAHTLFVDSNLELSDELYDFVIKKKALSISEEEIENFIISEARFFYAKPYGEKNSKKNLMISPNFTGEVIYNGNVDVTLQGRFSDEFSQIACYKNYLPIAEHQVLDFYLEYKKTGNMEIQLEIIKYVSGAVDTVEFVKTYNEAMLKDVVQFDAGTKQGLVFANIKAKGSGTLKIIDLHDRYSRGNHGYFIPGGERYVTSEGEEIFAYFDPGDMKPPLNVYFSGYKTMEGFEGYNLFRRMGSPMLLIAEARLEGGNFYMGSEEYEKLLEKIIISKRDELDFEASDVILAGLSMGTFGALYHSCKLSPHSVILGKPLISLGDIATNMRSVRPNDFATSLDILSYQVGKSTIGKAEELNNKIWRRIDGSDLSDTKFIIAYMKDDDYDSTAYKKLIDHICMSGVKVYGKGLPGRHNDDTSGIVSWFVNQFRYVFEHDFGRKVDF